MKKFLAFYCYRNNNFHFISAEKAVIVPPTEYAKDTLPPVVVRVHPENKTLHFRIIKSQLNFDEYVCQNWMMLLKTLMIIRGAKIFPSTEKVKKTVSIKTKDTLQQNTTYVFNFKMPSRM